MLTIVSLNLANDLRLWAERAPLILAELERLAPDVVALQEVSLPYNTAQFLADRLPGFTVLLGPKSRDRGRTEGLALLTRLPVLEHDRIELDEQDRVVQRAIVREGATDWELGNAHLHWSLRDDELRAAQVRRLIAHLRGDLPTAICGDFNARPGWRAVSAARERFVSAYATANGREPDYTFPTPLWRGPPLGPMGRRLAAALYRPLATNRRAPWRTTLDYIFVDERVRVVDCRLAFDLPQAGRPWLYPSDHLGLVASLTATEPGATPVPTQGAARD